MRRTYCSSARSARISILSLTSTHVVLGRSEVTSFKALTRISLKCKIKSTRIQTLNLALRARKHRYRLLGRSDDGKDFGPEAIEELMSEMTKGDPVMVFAGYKHDMERFFKSNAGLFRRVSRHFIFSDYTAKEIAQITFLVVKKKGFKFAHGTTVDKLAQMIERNTTQLQRSAFNGAMASRIFDLAKRNLDRRLSLKASADALVTFSNEDVQKALKEIPHPPKGSIIPMPKGSEDVLDSSEEDEDQFITTPMNNNSGGGGGDGLRIPVAILNNNK